MFLFFKKFEPQRSYKQGSYIKKSVYLIFLPLGLVFGQGIGPGIGPGIWPWFKLELGLELGLGRFLTSTLFFYVVLWIIGRLLQFHLRLMVEICFSDSIDHIF